MSFIKRKLRHSQKSALSESDEELLNLSKRLKDKEKSNQELSAAITDGTKENLTMSLGLPSNAKLFASYSPVVENWCVTQVNVVKTNFKWTIQNFSLYSNKPSEALVSSVFTAAENTELKWFLILYSRGEDEESKEYVSVSIQSTNKDKILTMFYELSFLDNQGINICTKNCTFKLDNKSWGWSKYCNRNKLTSLQNDTLIVFCTLSVSLGCTDIANNKNTKQLQEFQSQLQVLDDLQNFMERKEFCDIILTVNSNEFPAHRAILAARSSVFEALLKNDIREKKQSVINIENINCETLNEMLRFIYSGKVCNIENLAIDLFVAGDKYELTDLKTMCEMYLYRNLTPNNVFDILTLADQYNAKELKAQVINFITSHGNEIINSSGLNSIGNLNSSLTEEMFRTLLVKRGS